MEFAIALIQDFTSSSLVAWYTRRVCGVMTSKQKRRSTVRDSRTVAKRRLIGVPCC